MPSAFCLIWDQELIALRVVADGLAALAYYSIPAALFWAAARVGKAVPVTPLLVPLGLFIAFAGGGHILDIIAIWKPVHWLEGAWNAGTALTSMLAALVLAPKVADYVRMPEVTEKLRRETGELQQRQSLLRAVLDSVQEGIVLAARDGRPLLSNAAAAEILSAAGGELRMDWTDHAPASADVITLSGGRTVERFTRPVPGHGQLYIFRDVTEQRAREFQRLRLEHIVQEMRQGFNIVVPRTGEILAANPAFHRMMGYEDGELIGKNITVVNAGTPEEQSATADMIWDAVLHDGFWEGEVRNRRKDGSEFFSHARVNLHEEDGGSFLSTIQTDITRQKELEQERERLQQSLLHAQKLESLGVLAGGIAHDFNNLLTGIIGNASLALDTLPPTSPAAERLNDLMLASEKAAELTRQMLAYAGKGRFVVEPLNVSSLVRDISILLGSSISRHVSIELNLRQDVPPVEADAAQIQQIVMNLVINGAEAIGDKPGVVRVSTSARTVDAISAAGAPQAGVLEPCEYVVIEVEDNGSGMDRKTMEQIFDPFFTTKFTGRGLGLAAAQGIVRSHKGAITVQSEPGRGSRFSVFLPASGAAVSAPEAAEPAGDLAGSGLILIIDDEEMVRKAAQAALESYGYRVLTAENGQSGVDLFRRFSGQIDLVLLDMTMPVTSGDAALNQIREIQRNVPVLLSSGFDESEAVRKIAKGGWAEFVQKPYTSASLARKVKRALSP
jgi:PAS domain S-box-containing protein